MSPGSQSSAEHHVGVTNAQQNVWAAAAEFANRHAQEMVLIARKVREGESDPNERIGLTITLAASFTVLEAVRLAELIREVGFPGATFSPKGQGTIVVYHTDTLEMTPQAFEDTALVLLEELSEEYPQLNFSIQRFVICMRRP